VTTKDLFDAIDLAGPRRLHELQGRSVGEIREDVRRAGAEGWKSLRVESCFMRALWAAAAACDATALSAGDRGKHITEIDEIVHGRFFSMKSATKTVLPAPTADVVGVLQDALPAEACDPALLASWFTKRPGTTTLRWAMEDRFLKDCRAANMSSALTSLLVVRRYVTHLEALLEQPLKRLVGFATRNDPERVQTRVWSSILGAEPSVVLIHDALASSRPYLAQTWEQISGSLSTDQRAELTRCLMAIVRMEQQPGTSWAHQDVSTERGPLFNALAKGDLAMARQKLTRLMTAHSRRFPAEVRSGFMQSEPVLQAGPRHEHLMLTGSGMLVYVKEREPGRFYAERVFLDGEGRIAARTQLGAARQVRAEIENEEAHWDLGTFPPAMLEVGEMLPSETMKEIAIGAQTLGVHPQVTMRTAAEAAREGRALDAGMPG
jgi:hypothetical protein